MSSYADLFTVGDSSLQPTGSIRFSNELLRLIVVGNFVVHLGTRQVAGLCTGSNRDRFDRRNRHDSLGEQSIKFQIPGGVRAEPRNNTARYYLKDAAKRVTSLAFLIY